MRKIRIKIKDETLKQLRERAVSRQLTQRERSRNIRGIKYHGIDRDGDFKFSCSSEDGSTRYTQYFRFFDLPKLTEVDRKSVLNMLETSDVGVSSNDPSFLYWGGAYNATRGGWNIATENRGLNNPNRELKQNFTLSKHLIAVSRSLPFFWNTMIKDIQAWLDKYGQKEPEQTLEEKQVEPSKEVEEETENLAPGEEE